MVLTGIVLSDVSHGARTEPPRSRQVADVS